MALNKNEIMQLEHVLAPATRKFNIIEVIQKFPDNPHLHETFRQICLHYEQSSLSFKQIIQYLFGQFNKASELSPAEDKSQLFRIAKNYTQQQFKVALLGSQSEGIKELIMIDDKVFDDNKYEDAQLYAVTNTTLYQFNMKKQSFGDRILKLNNSVFKKVGVCGNILLYMNKINELYVQILPHKLAEVTKKQNKSKPKIQITKVLISRFPSSDCIISLMAMNQQEWVLCTKNKVRLIKLNFSSQIQQFKPVITEMVVSQDQDFAIISACLLEQSFVAILTNQQSIIIIHIHHMKITNSIYNDTNFAAFSYNSANQALIVSDFGGYLMSMKFNRDFGDIQEQGISYKKKKREQALPFQTNDQFQTRYLEKKRKSPQKHLVGDPPLSKQRKTAFSIVVQNTNRSVLEMILTKQKSIFTYEGKYQSIVKLWNVKNLLVYQKIDLSVKINDMKMSRHGLYLISSEKEYLCFYPMEVNDNPNSKKLSMHVLEVAVSSNMLYVNTTNMSESIIYKLNLSNKPSLTQYSRRASKNSEKIFKYAFYKNEVILFNLARPHSPTLQVSGVFGEPKQKIPDFRDYHSMIKYEQKQGVIIWGNKRVKIRGKFKANNSLYKRKQKGQYVVTNYAVGAIEGSAYTQTIIFSEEISKVKHFQNYITIITNSNSNSSSEKTWNVYVIDENTMCVILVFNELSEKYRVLQSHKSCSLIMKITKQKKKETKHSYFLYDHDHNRIIWVSEQISGWIFESVYMLNVNNSYVEILCIYKSNSIGCDKENKPVFYLIKSKIRLGMQDKKFALTLSREPNRVSQNQTHTIEQLFNRSIFRKATMKQLQNSGCFQQTVLKSNYKIYFPWNEIKKNESYLCSLKNRNKTIELDIKAIEGKLLYFDKYENNFMFTVTLNGMAILYQMSEQIQAQIIGILDFQLIIDDPVLTNSIVFWNKKYKKDDEELWEEAKDRAINRVKNNSPLALFRSDSMRQTSRMWNPESVQQQLMVVKQKNVVDKRSQSHKKLSGQIDPNRVNQMLYKKKIHENIIKQNSRTEEMNLKINKNQTREQEVNEKQIHALIQNIKQSKDLFEESKSNRNIKHKEKSFSLNTLKTEYSDMSTKYEMNKNSSKRRYETQSQAMAQLEKSKILEQLMLPKIVNTRTQSIQLQREKKNNIYQLLKKQNMSLKQSRNFPSKIVQ